MQCLDPGAGWRLRLSGKPIKLVHSAVNLDLGQSLHTYVSRGVGAPRLYPGKIGFLPRRDGESAWLSAPARALLDLGFEHLFEGAVAVQDLEDVRG